jgi:hypothetical protein
VARIAAMSRAARFLLLACSLFVALPPGWRCMLAGQLAQIAASGGKLEYCCECRLRAKTPAPVRPTPLPSDRCPCSNRQTVLNDSPPVAKCEFPSVAILRGPDLAPVLIGLEAEAVCVVHPPTCHLHVFKCVWRC